MKNLYKRPVAKGGYTITGFSFYAVMLKGYLPYLCNQGNT